MLVGFLQTPDAASESVKQNEYKNNTRDGNKVTEYLAD